MKNVYCVVILLLATVFVRAGDPFTPIKADPFAAGPFTLPVPVKPVEKSKPPIKMVHECGCSYGYSCSCGSCHCGAVQTISATEAAKKDKTWREVQDSPFVSTVRKPVRFMSCSSGG